MLKALLLAFMLLIAGIVHTFLGLFAPNLLAAEQPKTKTQTQTVAQQKTNRKQEIKTNLKKLPKNDTGEAEQKNLIRIAAGDSTVSKQTIQTTLGIINDISLPILQNELTFSPKSSVNIVLFSSKTTYAASLKKAGVDPSQIPALAANSGGLTVDSDIWIPLYALPGKPELANVLTHELTHVVFNQAGIGEQLPTWLNEGTAWYTGLAAQSKVNASETKSFTRELQNEVISAAKTGKLYPLSAGEKDILNAPYNIEFEDYLAVNYLVKHYGKNVFQDFLHKCTSQSIEHSFLDHFSMSLKTFEESAYQSLLQGE